VQAVVPESVIFGGRTKIIERKTDSRRRDYSIAGDL